MKYDYRKLKAERIEKRMTQTELAQRCGVTAGSISLVERGKRAWLKVIREMEAVLQIHVIEKTKNGKA